MMERRNESDFYAKIAMKKADHAGLMMLALFNLKNAEKKGNDTGFTKGLFVLIAVLFLLDDVEVLAHETKKILRWRS